MENATSQINNTLNDPTGIYLGLLILAIFVVVYLKLKKTGPEANDEVAKLYAACTHYTKKG